MSAMLKFDKKTVKYSYNKKKKEENSRRVDSKRQKNKQNQ